VVCGSLHSTARAQIDAATAAALAVAVPVPPIDDAVGRDAAVARACEHLAARRNVVLAAPSPSSAPPEPARRATEHLLAALTAAIVGSGRPRTLVLIGGETSYGVLSELGASTLAIRGRLAPLVAFGEVQAGSAAGAELVIKGGSGGDATSLSKLLGRVGETSADWAAV
jgi:uncharacterized protein YgbK (DUF1537 family)